MSWNVIIGAGCAIGSFLVAYVVFMRNRKKDDAAEGARNGEIMTEIGYIKRMLDEIKGELVEQRKINIEFVSRLTSIEESTKSAHRRIDAIEGKME